MLVEWRHGLTGKKNDLKHIELSKCDFKPIVRQMFVIL